MSYNAIVAGAAFVRIAMDDASLRQGLKEAQKRVNGFAKSWEVLKNKMSLDTSGSFLYFSNAVMPVANLIEHYKQFNDQMLALKAISGASQAQISALEKYIRHLGATTAFTAKQVAQGAVELSRMGFSSDDVKAGLKPALNLVRATGQETWRLGEISAYAASAVRIFGLQGKDFADVCDVMAYAANASNADIDDLGEALKIAGPSARTVNEDLRDTASALMLMSNAGIKGSLAGTSLRKIYQSLAAQSGKTAGLTEEQVKEGVRGIEAMRNLGVKVVDTDTGNLRKAADVMRDLAKAVTTLKSGEKVNFATEVFDLRGSLGALAMLNDADALQTFRQKLDDVEGYAEKTAKEMESGIGGVTRTFFSKLQELGLTVGKMAAEVFLPLLKAGISFFDKLSEFVKNNQFAIRFFGGLAMAGLTLGASLKVLSVAMDIAQKSFGAFFQMTSKLDRVATGAKKIQNSVSDRQGGVQAVAKAEHLKALAQKKSDDIRIASEKRRHYVVLQNAAKEAQAVAAAEAQKLSAAKARISAIESARFEGQSMKDIAAMSPESQASFFRASRDYYGANKAREQLAEMQQLQAGLNGQTKAYQASQAAASKSALTAEMARNQLQRSIDTAKASSAAYLSEAAAHSAGNSMINKKIAFLAAKNRVTLFSIALSKKHAASILNTSAIELASVRAGANASMMRRAGYLAEAAAIKTASAASLAFNKICTAISTNPITAALLAIGVAYTAISAIIEKTMNKSRSFNETRAKMLEHAEKVTQENDAQRKRDRNYQKRLKQLEILARQGKITDEQLSEAEDIQSRFTYGSKITVDKNSRQVKTLSDEEFAKAEQMFALEDARNELKRTEANIISNKKAYTELMSAYNEQKKTDRDNLLSEENELLKKRKNILQKIRSLERGEKNAIIGEEINTSSGVDGGYLPSTPTEKAEKRVLEIEEQLAKSRRTNSQERLFQLRKEREEYLKNMNMLIDAEKTEYKKNIKNKKYKQAEQNRAQILEDQKALKDNLAIFAEQEKEIKEQEQKRLKKILEYQKRADEERKVAEQDKADSRKIDKLLKKGNQNQAVEFIKTLIDGQSKVYQIARDKLAQMEKQFVSAESKGGKEITDIEAQSLREQQLVEKAAFERLQGYRDRLLSAREALNQSAVATTGSFSLKALAAQLGGGTVAERTAKASEEQVRWQKKIYKKIEDNNGMAWS